jgi:DNA helicase II / ATP-dependent DNA helicase PcrA
VRPLSPREAYVDYGDSQLPDDEPGPGGDGLSIGAKVVHPTFGRGIVRRREGRGDNAKAWVNFERGGIKLLVLKFANLRLIGD